MDYVELEKIDGVAVITLADPDRRNIASLPMSAELSTLFDELEADEEIGAIVLTGAAPAFSAGADLEDLLAGEHPAAEYAESLGTTRLAFALASTTPDRERLFVFDRVGMIWESLRLPLQ